MRRPPRPIKFLLLLVWLVLTLLAPPAGAADKAAAESLFRAGKELMDAGEYREACLKFKESHAAEASVGALLNLALCHEEQGKIASAWAYYGEAATLARKLNDAQRRAGAEKLQAELEPRLSMLTIRVTQQQDGLTVRRDGVVVPSFDAPLPVDPGNYEVVAQAPGFASWTGSVRVGPQGDRHTLTIPALQPLATSEGDEVAAAGVPWQTIVGWSLVGVGAVGVTVGVIFGAVATSNASDLETECPMQTCTSQAGDDLLATTETQANVSTAGIIIGSAAAVGGVVLLLLAPPDTVSAEDGSDVALWPVIGPDTAGVTLAGRF